MEKETKYKVKIEQQIDHYKEYMKEVLDSYYRRKKDKDSEDTAEICLIYEANRLINNLATEYRLNNEMVNVFLGLTDVYVKIDDEYIQWEPTEELESRGYNLTPEE
jgi:hypothetical protein